ncbi:Serine protease/ABC transporter B family protein tagD [Porphyridium purpureum]|uniref:Serine protease/ABC transporter B family protein tagD n=1 Tax=Porphyridium purpureum TaxID=35688 RepID=A0A5J4YKQ5_PORPP|nr:Serine protease/ABC transporter B family protein tagD [Porphyridium purpureum]|eukprot:POR6553..scf261_15
MDRMRSVTPAGRLVVLLLLACLWKWTYASLEEAQPLRRHGTEPGNVNAPNALRIPSARPFLQEQVLSRQVERQGTRGYARWMPRWLGRARTVGQQSEEQDQKQHYLIILESPQERARVQRQFGITLSHVYSVAAYDCLLSLEQALELHEDAAVVWMGRPNGTHKLSTSVVLARAVDSRAPSSSQMLSQWLAQPIFQRVAGISIEADSPASLRLTVTNPAAGTFNELIAHLQSQDSVIFVELARSYALLNRYSAAVLQSGNETGPARSESALLWRHNIGGQGQMIHISDTGVDYDGCYFRDTLDSWTPVDNTGACYPEKRNLRCYFSTADFHDAQAHGTHVAGTAAGRHAGTITGDNSVTELADLDQNNGMAPGALIVFTDIGLSDGTLVLPQDLSGYFLSEPYNRGARISSHSWGCFASDLSACYTYDLQSRSTDAFLFSNLDAVALFAAGNSGTAYTPYGDGRRTVSAPALAKNIISVGATQTSRQSVEPCDGNVPCSAQNLALFSSRGRTFDERYKPDLVFVGERVFSARSSGDPTDGDDLGFNAQCQLNFPPDDFRISGTSMATPGVAGAAAMVRQYLMEFDIRTGRRRENGTFPDGKGPSGALVKAMLMQAAEVPTGTYQYLQSSGLFTFPLSIRESDDPRALVGRGLPNLRRIVRFDDDDAQTRRRQVFPHDRYQLLSAGETLTWRFGVSDTDATLKVTLIYHDAPGPLVDAGSASSGTPVLINDLDLVVRCSGVACAFTELNDLGRTENVAQVTASTATLEDLVVCDTLADASLTPDDCLAIELTVIVSAEKISIGPQQFALVVSGLSLEEIAIPPSNFEPNWSTLAADPPGDDLGEDPSSNDLPLVVIIGAAVGGAVLAISVAVCFCIIRRGRNSKTVDDFADGPPALWSQSSTI